MWALPTFEILVFRRTDDPDSCSRGSSPAWATHCFGVIPRGSTSNSASSATALFSAIPRTLVKWP
jgi:hypothetical protein